MKPLRVLSLFSGIGGMDDGLERAGMRVVGQCEISPWCRLKLAEKWPGVPAHDDITTLGTDFIEQCGKIDIIAGGFPCQDVSSLGRRKGFQGAKSGLWYEMRRIIGMVRPQYVIVENVPALLYRGLDTILGDFAALGYDAEWETLPAGAFGAPHLRARVFLVAYTTSITGPRALFSSEAKRSRFLNLQPRRSFGVYVPGSNWEADQPAICGVDDGNSDWAPTMRALGNAVVPAVAEFVGRIVVEHHENAAPTHA